MGPMWSDGLPLFYVLCSLFMGLIVRGSSSSEFHSFNRKFLSLSLSLFTSVIATSLLDPTALDLATTLEMLLEHSQWGMDMPNVHKI